MIFGFPEFYIFARKQKLAEGTSVCLSCSSGVSKLAEVRDRGPV